MVSILETHNLLPISLLPHTVKNFERVVYTTSLQYLLFSSLISLQSNPIRLLLQYPQKIALIDITKDLHVAKPMVGFQII